MDENELQQTDKNNYYYRTDRDLTGSSTSNFSNSTWLLSSSGTSQISITDGLEAEGLGRYLSDQLAKFEAAVYQDGSTEGLAPEAAAEAKLWAQHQLQLRVVGRKMALRPGEDWSSDDDSSTISAHSGGVSPTRPAPAFTLTQNYMVAGMRYGTLPPIENLRISAKSLRTTSARLEPGRVTSGSRPTTCRNSNAVILSPISSCGVPSYRESSTSRAKSKMQLKPLIPWRY